MPEAPPRHGPRPPSGGSLETLREANRARIMDALRELGAASRGDLARATGLSRSTVTTLVGELQRDGLVVETEEEVRARSGPGRPPSYLRATPAAGAVLGVDFGHRHVRVAIADLSCRILEERAADVDVDTAASGALDAAAAMVEDVLRAAGVARDAVVAAGMGLPGPLDRATGSVGSSVILPDWEGLRPADQLRDRIGVPVHVDNDANLGVLAEHAFGAGQGSSDVVYVKVSSGIGAGLILGGRLHRGGTGIAGELGHVQLRPDGVVCRCGSRGCLETVAAVPALIAAMQPAHRRPLALDDVLELLRGGDLGARRVVADAGRMIGRALGDLCNSINPTSIVVGGELVAAGQPLLDGVRAGVDQHAQPGAAAAVTTSLGVLGDRAEVLGALTLAAARHGVPPQ